MSNNCRSLNWNLVLYPNEDESHKNALEYIEKNYDYYAYINHDMDIDKNGDLKKEHTHVVIKFKNYRWKNAIAEELRIPANYLEKCNNLDSSLKYLIHFENQDKYQYDLSLVKGRLRERLNNLINHYDMTESEKYVELMDFIHRYPTYLTLHDFMKYVCSTPLFSVYRRNATSFHMLIKEHNIEVVTHRTY